MTDPTTEVQDLAGKFEHRGCRVFNTLQDSDYLIPMEFDTMYDVGVGIAGLLCGGQAPASVLRTMEYVAGGIEGVRHHR